MTIYKGETVADGVALGHVHLEGYENAQGYPRRISSDQVEEELNRLRDALAQSRAQIEELKSKHKGNLGAHELRIFDAQVGYLQDTKFINEIETLVMEERLSARASIHRVVDSYDRIFQLVENDHLRQRAVDLRDVATRVLRNLRDDAREVHAEAPSGRYILAARKLVTTDMFNLDNEQVEGIVAEEGGISSHAAILARSMGIPTITGIRNLPGKLEHGAFVILDASSGELHVNPDERLRSEYAQSTQKVKQVPLPPADREHVTRDGHKISLMASCGSVGEVNLSRTMGMDGIGLFRTELLFLVEDTQPSEELLVRQYTEVVREPSDRPVNFRLLDISSASRVLQLPNAVERNPSMGMRGIRALLHDGDVLRLQLRAILRAAAGTEDTGVLIPFVTGLADMQRVKAAILEERQELRKKRIPCADTLRVAPIIEVPAAAFVLHAFLHESDFVVVAIDDLQAHLLAADRDNTNVREYYEAAHPAQFELISRMAREASKAKKNLILFGEGAADQRRVPFYLGVGITSFSVAPVRLTGMLKVLRRFTVSECNKIADRILNAPRALDVQRVLVRLFDQ
ncbi:MAG: phosphoenolpyruvate--protein phosphotransferase [Planctomycetota bacterium]|jgi:phosphotransferase system enzyme I (PtsI)